MKHIKKFSEDFDFEDEFEYNDSLSNLKISIDDAWVLKQIDKMAKDYAKTFDYAEDSDPYTSFIEGAKAALILKNKA